MIANDLCFMNYFKPSKIAFYLLSVLAFFFIGVIYVAISGAAKNQGLAGGAIVFGYGIMGSFFGLILSIILVRYLTPKVIIYSNSILLLIILGFVAYFLYKFKERQKIKTEDTGLYQQKPKFLKTSSEAFLPAEIEDGQQMGIGMAKPDFFQHKTLYFYGNPNLDKPVMDHSPNDSLVFRQTELGFEISYAPPWFVPAHMKMDYEVVYLRAMSLHSEFIEVVVNETNGQTSFIDRSKSKLIFWPEFLLSVNSVEPIVAEDNLVRIKPLSHASPVNGNYEFLRPIRISDQWIFVELLTNDLNPHGKAWIKWNENGRLLIRYNLFS